MTPSIPTMCLLERRMGPGRLRACARSAQPGQILPADRAARHPPRHRPRKQHRAPERQSSAAVQVQNSRPAGHDRRRTGVAAIPGLKFSRIIAWWLWRSIYLSKLPGFQKKARVSLDWPLDLIFSKDLVQLPMFRSLTLSEGNSSSTRVKNEQPVPSKHRKHRA